MTAVVLPTSPGIVDPTALRLVDGGGLQIPALQGVIQHCGRLGTRHAIDVTLPPMNAATAMPWIQRLKRGKSDMVRMLVPQPGFTPTPASLPGDISGTPAAAATAISVFTHVAGYPYKEGQLISIEHDGRSYLYGIDADGTADGSGLAAFNITPPLRTALSSGDDVQLVSPIIEGFPQGDETKWGLSEAAIYGLTFTIIEAA